MTTQLHFDGVLFFPVTPFTPSGEIGVDSLAEHLEAGLSHEPGGVFPACGTGEYHALSVDEVRTIVRTTVDVVGRRVPVVAGAGGPLGHALASVRAAEEAGADAVLVLPPYLVAGPMAGTVAYAEAVSEASELPVILYHRGTAGYSPDAVAHLAANRKVIGFKDGVGDVALTQTIVRAVHEVGRQDFLFFNGLLTAELSQAAYRGIGVPLYSSAAFAMVPEVAAAHYLAYTSGDEQTRLAFVDSFYRPLVQLRDETPGFGVSLIKAGLALRGRDVGGVRPPLVDPSAAQLERLARIIDAGLELVERVRSRGAATGRLGADEVVPA